MTDSTTVMALRNVPTSAGFSVLRDVLSALTDARA